MPIPVPAGQKGPRIRRWQDLRLNENDLPRHFGQHENIGILLGEPSGGLVDVDLDSPEATRLADKLLPGTNCVFGRPSKPRSHRLYLTSLIPKTEKFVDPSGKVLVEMRSTGSQTIFPPSIHPSGEAIAFDEDGPPARIAGSDLREGVARLAAAALLVRSWPTAGSRQETALALAGALLRGGWSEIEAGDFIEVVARAAGDNEAAKRRETAGHTAQKLKTKAEVTSLSHLADLLGKDVVGNPVRWLALNHKGAPTSETGALGLKLEDGVMKAYRPKRNLWEQVYNKSIIPLARLRGSSNSWLVRVGNEPPVKLDSEALSSARQLKRILPPTGAWTGTDNDAQALIPYFESYNVPEKTSVDIIGWHGDHVVFPNAVLGPSGIESDSLLEYTGQYRAARLQVIDDWPSLARAIGDVLLKLHQPGAIHAIAGWSLATFAAPEIRGLTSRGFPLLNVWGNTGSGKTTLLSLLSRLTGSTREPISIEGGTDFSRTMNLSSSNTLPMVLDEHRTGRRHGRFYATLREAFQEEEHERGRADLSVMRRALISPVAVAGESALPDPALRQRALIVKLSHDLLGPLDPPSPMRVAKATFERLPLADFAAGFYQHIRGKDIPALWREEAARLARVTHLNTDERKNLGPITAMVGLRLFEDFLTSFNPDEAAKLIAQVTDDEEEPSPVNEIIIALFSLTQKRELRSDQDLKLDGDSLFFNPALVLPKLANHMSEERSAGPGSKDALREALRIEQKQNAGQKIVRNMRAGKRLGGVSEKAIELGIPAIEDAVGITREQWDAALNLTRPNPDVWSQRSA